MPGQCAVVVSGRLVTAHKESHRNEAAEVTAGGAGAGEVVLGADVIFQTFVLYCLFMFELTCGAHFDHSFEWKEKKLLNINTNI